MSASRAASSATAPSRRSNPSRINIFCRWWPPELVDLSRPEEERFVIFYERPQGKKLSELLAQNQHPMNLQFLCDRIIAPLAAAINQFGELDITHGAINPDNIYFDDIAVLGPCVSEPCGYSQPFYCEPLERMQALPAAKGEGSTGQDYYALAITVLHAMHGSSHFAHFTPEIADARHHARRRL